MPFSQCVLKNCCAAEGENEKQKNGDTQPYMLYTIYKCVVHYIHLWTKLNKSAIPVNSGLLLLVMSGIMMLTGSFDMLTDLLVFVMWFFYTATFFAVIILRKKDPDLERPYKVPLYPIIPIIAILGGIYTLISTLTSQITLALGGIGLTLIGLLFYKELHKKFKK